MCAAHCLACLYGGVADVLGQHQSWLPAFSLIHSLSQPLSLCLLAAQGVFDTYERCVNEGSEGFDVKAEFPDMITAVDFIRKVFEYQQAAERQNTNRASLPADVQKKLSAAMRLATWQHRQVVARRITFTLMWYQKMQRWEDVAKEANCGRLLYDLLSLLHDLVVGRSCCQDHLTCFTTVVLSHQQALHDILQ